jgi:hypothetical protein
LLATGQPALGTDGGEVWTRRHDIEQDIERHQAATHQSTRIQAVPEIAVVAGAGLDPATSRL